MDTTTAGPTPAAATDAAPAETGGPGPTGEAGSSSVAAMSAQTSGEHAAAQDAAAGLVRTRVEALAAKDRVAWMTTVADGPTTFGTDQGALFDRMARLPLAPLSTLEITVRPLAANPPGDTWVADLRLAYQLVGYDRGPRAYSVSYLLSPTPAGWRFSGPGPGRTDPQPFDLQDLTVVRSASTLVVGDAPPATLRSYLALGDTAHTRVAAAWGEALPAVIVVPKTVDELATQLGSSPDRFGQVGAVTDGPRTDAAPATSDRVYVNPGAPLSDAGRLAVVTHELTHVAVRGTTIHEAPLWLAEGFADDVGMRATGVPVRVLAAGLLADVRAGKGPGALPVAQAFDPARSTIEPAYTAAWLAVDEIRQQYGEAKVVAFYRAVCGTPAAQAAPGASADERARAAFETVLGTTQDAFVTHWLAALAALAH